MQFQKLKVFILYMVFKYATISMTRFGFFAVLQLVVIFVKSVAK